MRTLALSAVAVVSAFVLGSTQPVAHAATDAETNKPASPVVTIQPGDSLSKIASAHSSTIQRLYDANTEVEDPDMIFPGEKVRVPSPDEVLTTRPMPVDTVQIPTAAVPIAPQAILAPQPTQRTAPVQAAPVAGGSVWDQLAACESGGNWSINTGNGYYGGLQFSLSSWQAVGGSGLPSDASREEQIMRAESLKAAQGWGAWPACTSKLGLR